jgi:YfiH family protein
MVPHPAGGLVFESLQGLPGLRHVVTTRTGGVSVGPFASLNLGFVDGDDPRNVVENRRRAAAALGTDIGRLVVPRQAHTDTVAIVGTPDAGRGALDDAGAPPRTDGLATGAPGVTLLVQSADCPLILIHDAVRGAIAAVHAGWRGALAGIAGRAVAMLRERLGCDPADLRACIGPSVGPCCYEVDEDVAEAFARVNPAGLACLARTGRRAVLDLRTLNASQLVAAGIRPDRIEVARVCTRCDAARFFSVRRDGNRTGRFGLLATLA